MSNCVGSSACYSPASSPDAGGVVNRPPSPLTVLFSRHTRRRGVMAWVAAAAVLGSQAALWQQPARLPRLAIVNPISQAYPSFFDELARRLGYEEGRNLIVEPRACGSSLTR